MLDALESEAGALFKERAHKAVINALCGELKNLQKQVNEKSIRCESYEQRRSEREKAAAHAQQIEAQVTGLTREHSLAGKLKKCFPRGWR